MSQNADHAGCAVSARIGPSVDLLTVGSRISLNPDGNHAAAARNKCPKCPVLARNTNAWTKTDGKSSTGDVGARM